MLLASAWLLKTTLMIMINVNAVLQDGRSSRADLNTNRLDRRQALDRSKRSSLLILHIRSLTAAMAGTTIVTCLIVAAAVLATLVQAGSARETAAETSSSTNQVSGL